VWRNWKGSRGCSAGILKAPGTGDIYAGWRKAGDRIKGSVSIINRSQGRDAARGERVRQQQGDWTYVGSRSNHCSQAWGGHLAGGGDSIIAWAGDVGTQEPRESHPNPLGTTCSQS
jgi:hypothetical protein